MKLLKFYLIYGQKYIGVFPAANFNKIGGVEMNGNLTLVEGGATIVSHFGYVLMIAIDIESGGQLIVKLGANQDTKHIFLLTGKSQK
jgi:hypothetical protein